MDDFETLLAGSKTAVERWVKARMSNPADAEDILQETYLAAFKGYRELRNPAVFLPWILSIARRKCADWYRMKARRNEILLDEFPEKAAEESPDNSAVEETLEALPERDRLMLRLFYQEMLSQKQISEQLKIPEGTVKSRMSMARFHFRTAYPYPPKGEIIMSNKMLKLPAVLPEYSIVWKDEPAFAVNCEELTGWFIVPKIGEKVTWGMYDLPSRKLDVSYEMAVTGPANVHGLDGVAIHAKVIEATAAEGDPMKAAVDASTGGQEEWFFTAQEKDGYTRFLSAEHIDNGVRTLTTFLDGDAFMDNWGLGEENCGTPVAVKSWGKIQRKGSELTVNGDKPFVDVAGRCDVTLDGTLYETICVMDFGDYNEGVISEQYLDRSGHTVLWRRFNRDDWAGKCWSELLPNNEQIVVNGQRYVHWYDCLCVR